MSQSTPITEALTANAEELGTKCFVGNIAFATTNEDLKTKFSEAGEVIDAQIITRGKRSLGYAFVTFKREQDAAAATSKFDKSQLNDRTINVEIAKPAKHAPGGALAEAAAETARDQGLGDRGGHRGRGRARRGGVRRALQPDGEADATVENGINGVQDGPGKTRGSGAQRGGRGRGRGARRGPVGPPTGEPSSTLLFVANLPFQLDSDGLKEVFKNYKVKTAHVVTRKYGATSGRSKGFGFVEVENAHEQQRAVADLNGKQVETPAGSRELSVKVAINAEHQGDDAHDPDKIATITGINAADAAANA